MPRARNIRSMHEALPLSCMQPSTKSLMRISSMLSLSSATSPTRSAMMLKNSSVSLMFNPRPDRCSPRFPVLQFFENSAKLRVPFALTSIAFMIAVSSSYSWSSAVSVSMACDSLSGSASFIALLTKMAVRMLRRAMLAKAMKNTNRQEYMEPAASMIARNWLQSSPPVAALYRHSMARSTLPNSCMMSSFSMSAGVRSFSSRWLATPWTKTRAKR
mmetsp:Transcript_40604/g.120400  ORF Transcript_40604/g.120400 Transcript_40604/m.120400 type:complete len:216 (+) Transcript_40604:314-961(+)